MINFMHTLREICGDETGDEFLLPVATVNLDGSPATISVPNYLAHKQKEVFPRIVINPFISFIPTLDGEDTDGTRFTVHDALIQVDVLTELDVQAIHIVREVNRRFWKFFNVQIHNYYDDRGWSAFEGIQRNTNYRRPKKIIGYGEYDHKGSIDDVKESTGSWFIDDTGIYVNGNTNLRFRQVINDALVFEDNTSVRQRGFGTLEADHPMRQIPGEEKEHFRLTLAYSTLYTIRDEYKIGPISGDGIVSIGD